MQSPERRSSVATGSINRPSKTSSLNLPLVIASMVAVLSLLANVWLGLEVKKLKNDPSRLADQENTALVADVRSLMVLPDEQPTIATVTDLEKLKGQSFFDHAQVGFKVFVFTQAKKAVLYDPTSHKIIEVAPLSATETDTTTSATEPTNDSVPQDDTATDSVPTKK